MSYVKAGDKRIINKRLDNEEVKQENINKNDFDLHQRKYSVKYLFSAEKSNDSQYLAW